MGAVGNLLGSLFVAYFLAVQTGVVTGELQLARLADIATAKGVEETEWQIFLRALGCNWLVCLAVWMALGADDVAGKILAIFFPIMAFVAMGFDHVVANMFFLPAAIFADVPGIGWGDALHNWLFAFLGNLVGAGVSSPAPTGTSMRVTPSSPPPTAGVPTTADARRSAPRADPVALTSLSHGAGCGCKLPAATLLPIVRGLPRSEDPALLVGSDTADDAAVWRLREDVALVQTVDFFTPIVDDPYDFGRIAAANALSDVYAMGGRPVTALNLVAFPLERLGGEVLREILRGGQAVVAAAGAAVVGGHSIDDAEPKYGLAVTGVVHPDEVIDNAGGRPGDALVLTKPLGVGAVTTARKRGARDDALLARAVAVMVELNDEAAAAARATGARAMTDVTGFGLLGHLHGLARASGVAAEVEAAFVPAVEGVEALLREGDGAVSGGSERNAAYAGTFATIARGVPAWRRRLVTDATTSGGLLVAVPEGAAGAVGGVRVGRLLAGPPGAVSVV